MKLAAFAIDADPPGIVPGTCSGIKFQTDDVAVARARLAEGGVEVTDVMESPVCWFAFAKDLDGTASSSISGKRRRNEAARE